MHRARPDPGTLSSQHGLDALEGGILTCLVREGPSNRATLAARSTPSRAWDPVLQWNAEQALDRCFLRGLIRHLTAEDAEEDRNRWGREDDECCSSDPYEEGFFDLTPAGAALVERMLVGHRAGRPGGPWRGCVGARRNSPSHITAFAERKAHLRRYVQRERAAAAREGLEFSVRGPHPVGRWWLHRRISLPAGWRVELHRRRPPTEADRAVSALLERHAVRVAELSVLRGAYEPCRVHPDAASQALWSAGVSGLGAFTLQEARAAVERLRARGCVVDGLDYGSPLPNSRPGQLELTRLGARLLRLLEEGIAAAQGRGRWDGRIRQERGKDGCIRLRAPRKQDLEQALLVPGEYRRRTTPAIGAGPIRAGGAYRPHPYEVVGESWIADLIFPEPTPSPAEQRAGLTERECSILGSVRLLPPMDRHAVACHARAVAMTGHHLEYAAALDSLLERGLLAVLTPEACAADAARWEADDANACADDRYLPGRIALTAAGHRVELELAGEGMARYASPTLYQRWISPNQYALFCADEAHVRARLALPYDEWGRARRRITPREGPRLIGLCWINRFQQVPGMWRTDIRIGEGEGEGPV